MDDCERLLKIASIRTAISILEDRKGYTSERDRVKVNAGLSDAIEELNKLGYADTHQYDEAVREIFPDPEAAIKAHKADWEKMQEAEDQNP